MAISMSRPMVLLGVISLACLYKQVVDAGKTLSPGPLLSDFATYTPALQANILVATLFTAYFVIKMVCGSMYETDPLARTWDFVCTFFRQEKLRGINVNSYIDEYNAMHDDGQTSLNDRNSKYKTLVNAYYELATLFYEWGWGASFHFAERWANETFAESIKRHEYYLAGRLGVKKGSKVLDCGCGIGGPYRNICRFTGADITGITINEYQVRRANELNRKMGLDKQVRSVQGDFMQLPFEDNSFDGVYAIEATCHAPKREGVYSEIYRVLKPGQVFACYEWCLTDKHDPSNAEHLRIKKQIEEGDGLPDMCTPEVVDKALLTAGFEIIESRDMALDPNPEGIPWYQPLTPSLNPFTQRFQFTKFGMAATKAVLWVMEAMRLAPAGTYKVQGMLQEGGVGCAQGGIQGTFTPMYLAVCRKPLTSQSDKEVEASRPVSLVETVRKASFFR